MKKESKETSPSIQQKGRTINGVVTDEKGETIIGANVSVKGTTIGTITDIDGKFTLDIPGRSKAPGFLYRLPDSGYHSRKQYLS